MRPDLDKEFQELLSNQSFIDWINTPSPELDKYWNTFVKENPFFNDEIEHAKYIVKRLNIKNPPIDESLRHEMWRHVQSELDTPSTKVRTVRWWVAAASFLVLAGVGSVLFFLNSQSSHPDFDSVAKIDPSGNEVKLILSDNSEKIIGSKSPSFDYSSHGKVVVDSKLEIQQEEKSKIEEEEILNQIVVPYGKRSTLILSDGTEVTINSGSRVIYPVAFNKKKREIYIEGEAYLSVSHNPDWPFYVETDHLEVRVLGTGFNIKSYKNEAQTSVVLVQGSVQAIAGSGKVLMKESELLSVSNQTGETKIEKVNIIEHISWKDGWLNCNNESIGSIATKLSRYYNVTIQTKSEEVGNMEITGKLDLKTDVAKVLDVMSFIAPVKYEITDGKIILSTKY